MKNHYPPLPVPDSPPFNPAPGGGPIPDPPPKPARAISEDELPDPQVAFPKGG